MKHFYSLLLISISLFFFLFSGLQAQVPENWQDDTGIVPFKSDEIVYEGNFSCGIEVNTGTQADCDLSNLVEIPVNAGESFKISFWYFTSEHVRLRAAFDWNDGSATYSPNYAGPTSTGDWELFEYEGTVSENVTGVNVRIRSYDVSGFSAPEIQYLDMITFESPVGNPLTVANGYFENWPTALPEPSNYPTEFTAIATGQQIQLDWHDATGEQLPDAYLILMSDEDEFIPPADADFVVDDLELEDGEGAINVAFGEEQVVVSNFLPETTYYFRIYSYTNAGAEVNYKTDGVPPSANATTGELQPELTVLAPQEGVTWYRGGAFDVEWFSLNLDGDVLIEVTGNASSGNPAWTELATVAASAGVYSWNIPDDYPNGSDYQIRLSSQLLPLEALSGIFSIDDEPEIPLVVINEIMYNPPPELGDDDYWEFIEIYNNDTESVDLSGWSFSDGIDFNFPDGTTLGAGAYLVIARVPDTIADYYGISNITGPFENATALSNGGENVEISDGEGNVVDAVEYGDGGDWPTEPDGDGPSLSLINPDLDNSLPESWEASVVPFGTPGIINNPEEPFLAVTFPNGGEMLQKELTYDITWAYDDLNGNISIELVSLSGGTTMLMESVDVTLSTWAWEIGESIPTGDDFTIKITSLETPDVTDESDNVFSIIDLQPLPDLVITEIMYNPPESGTDSLEFLEIYNNDDFTVLLEGFYFNDGVEFTFPDISLEPAAYLLVAVDSLAMQNTFDVAAWQWSGGALSNGGETVELMDSFDNVVDAVTYSDQLPWDTLADGGGSSLTLCDPDTDNSLPENWLASAEYAAVNDEGAEIYATPGGPCVTTGFFEAENDADFKIFPNPNNGIFTLQTGTDNPVNVAIHTITGAKIRVRKNVSGAIDFNQKLLPGIYLVSIENAGSGEIAYKKLIIQQ